MRKSTKIMVALGVVAGLGVAALPLGSSSALVPTLTEADDSATVTLSAGVSSAYALAVDSATKSIATVNPGDAVATATGTVTAAANSAYKVTAVASANEGAMTTTGGDSIPAATTGIAVEQGTSAWGIMGGDLGTSAYTGLGESRTLKSSTGSSAAAGDEISVTYGVSAAAGQATGTYSATITYTITAP